MPEELEELEADEVAAAAELVVEGVADALAEVVVAAAAAALVVYGADAWGAWEDATTIALALVAATAGAAAVEESP